MAITVKHTKVSAVVDSADTSLVRPSDWNADHTLVGVGTAAALDAGVANGVATLDSAGKVPVSQIPQLGDLNYQGTWNASTNTPTLVSSTGTKGYYYVVSVAGTTNLDGITDWKIGDWAVFNGTAWQKVDNTDQVTSVNGQTGAVVLTTTNVAEGTNEYFTTARARASVSAGTAISYDSGTGVIANSAPDQTVVLTAGTGISTSGTYPNFTITNTSPSLGGDVVGPASATDNAVARFDATTGKLIQNSVVIIDDAGSVTGVNSLTAQSLTVNNNSTLGSSNTDTLDVNARITTDLEPNANNAKDIGTSGRNWRDGFFGRNLTTVTLNATDINASSEIISANSATNALRITQVGTGNALLVEDSANPDATPFVINSVGNVLVGGSQVTGLANSSPIFQITGYGDGSIGQNAPSMALNAFLPNGGGHFLNFNRSNGATVGTNTIVTNGDQLGFINWGGADGTNYIRAARIYAEVDGTPGTNDMPGRLVFSTTADGASSPTERMRIDSAGRVGIGGNSVNNFLTVTGTIPTSGTGSRVYGNSTSIPSTTTSFAIGFHSELKTIAASFTLTELSHFKAQPTAFGAGSTVTSQYGYLADSSLTGATNNYGFYGNIASGTGRYNFYANGTADNYFAGNVGLGTSTPGAKLAVVGTGYSPNITLTDAATIAWNTATGQTATFTFTGTNRTMGAPTNLVNGAFYALAVIQNGGSNTLTWNSVFKWAGGVAPTLSTAAGAKDYFTFRSDGTNLYEQGRSLGVA